MINFVLRQAVSFPLVLIIESGVKYSSLIFQIFARDDGILQEQKGKRRVKEKAWPIEITTVTRATKIFLGPQGKRKLRQPLLQIMILKISPPRRVISRESVQQK